MATKNKGQTKRRTARRTSKAQRAEAAQRRAELRKLSAGKDVLDLDEAAAVLDCDPRPVARAARAHLAGAVGLRCAKASNSLGFKITRSSLMEWVDCGMPGSDYDGEVTT